MRFNPGLFRFITLLDLERATGDDAVDWAICELEFGNDSDSLRMLAGTPKPALMSDVGHLVEDAFSRFGYDKLVPLEITVRYVAHLVSPIAKAIVDGKLDPLKGRDDICDIFEEFGCNVPMEDKSLNLFEWWEMFNGYHPKTLDPIPEVDLVPHIVRYAAKLVEEHFNRNSALE